VHTTGVPAQVPPEQMSDVVQRLPSLQAAPFAMSETIVVPAGPAAHPAVIAVTL
jgi:hypothetical protein